MKALKYTGRYAQAGEVVAKWDGERERWARFRTPRLRYVAGTKWCTRRYLEMNRLAEASEAA